MDAEEAVLVAAMPPTPVTAVGGHTFNPGYTVFPSDPFEASCVGVSAMAGDSPQKRVARERSL